MFLLCFSLFPFPLKPDSKPRHKLGEDDSYLIEVEAKF